MRKQNVASKIVDEVHMKEFASFVERYEKFVSEDRKKYGAVFMRNVKLSEWLLHRYNDSGSNTMVAHIVWRKRK